MQVGSAWVKTEEKDGKKTVVSISIKLEDAILEVCPQLKNVRFNLKPNDRKDNDKAPHYRLSMYKPQEQTAAASDDAITDEDIPF